MHLSAFTKILVKSAFEKLHLFTIQFISCSYLYNREEEVQS